VVKLLLDGQQRMTSLYGVVRGKPPKFFDGNAQAFTVKTWATLDATARWVRALGIGKVQLDIARWQPEQKALRLS